MGKLQGFHLRESKQDHLGYMHMYGHDIMMGISLLYR